MKRQALSFNKLSLTDFKINVSRSAREKQLRKAYEAADVSTRWEQTAWARRIAKKATRRGLTDFDRFKLRVLRQQVSTGVNNINLEPCVHKFFISCSEISHCEGSVQQDQERGCQKVTILILTLSLCF